MTRREQLVAFLLGMAFGLAWWLLWLLVVFFLSPIPVQAAPPPDAERYRRELIRNARLAWGLDAPIATFGAQIEAESSWRPEAVSPAGARGMAQFMPATATWISGAYAALAPSDPHNPVWALRALATYDRYLWERVYLATTPCERAAFMLSAYNGGEDAREHEVDLCVQALPCDPARWWDNVERMRWRTQRFWNENRGYVRRVLRALEPTYAQAGWGMGLCVAISGAHTAIR